VVEFAVEDSSRGEPESSAIIHPAGSGQGQGQPSRLPSSVSHICTVWDRSSVVDPSAIQTPLRIDARVSTDGLNAAAMQGGSSGDDRGDCVRTQDDIDIHEEARTYQSTSRPPADSQVLIVKPVTGSAQSSVAQKLCDQLLHGIHGCSRAQHEQKLGEHIESVGNNRNGLSIERGI
jgi:hypothetical protein